MSAKKKPRTPVVRGTGVPVYATNTLSDHFSIPVAEGIYIIKARWRSSGSSAPGRRIPQIFINRLEQFMWKSDKKCFILSLGKS
ncbi:MAG: hypothetical protein LBQ73_05520 [Tannerellaceae bacterium]|nr:hypothetical protein [Tannerellaceae bacterium]